MFMFLHSYSASFALSYINCRSAQVIRLYIFRKGVSSFRWSTDPSVFISYPLCLIYKGSEFGTVFSAKSVIAIAIAQSNQIVNSTDKTVTLALAITPGIMVSGSSYGVLVSTAIYSIIWCKVSCFPKQDAQCEPKLKASQ